MKTVFICISLILIATFPHQANGQIFTWVDENGVKHFGNDVPPPGAEILRTDTEIPYDAAGDEQRQEAEEKYSREMQKTDSENKQPPEKTDREQERQSEPNLVETQADSGGAVSDRERLQEKIENKDARATDADRVPPPGGQASEEGKTAIDDPLLQPVKRAAERAGRGSREGAARP